MCCYVSLLCYVFSLSMCCFHSALLLFLPSLASQNHFSCYWLSHILLPALKIPCTLSIFSKLCLLLEDKVVVALLQFYLFFVINFCNFNFLLLFNYSCVQFYLYIFTILVFQISNFTIPFSYSILPSSYPFFFSSQILIFPCLRLVFVLYS